MIDLAKLPMYRDPTEQAIEEAAERIRTEILPEMIRARIADAIPVEWQEPVLVSPQGGKGPGVLVSHDGPTYRIVEVAGQAGIECGRCLRTSFSAGDLLHKYCVACDAFHTEGRRAARE
jgi:hypothetical protein